MQSSSQPRTTVSTTKPCPQVSHPFLSPSSPSITPLGSLPNACPSAQFQASQRELRAQIIQWGAGTYPRRIGRSCQSRWRNCWTLARDNLAAGISWLSPACQGGTEQSCDIQRVNAACLPCCFLWEGALGFPALKGAPPGRGTLSALNLGNPAR